MIDYLMLFISPSKALDKLKDKKSETLTLYLLGTIIFAAIAFPKLMAMLLNNPNGLAIVIGYLILILLIYFPFTYGIGFLYWIIAKGFKGVSSFIEMRTLIVYSIIPFALSTFISVPYLIIGLIRKDSAIILHDNYFANLIFGFLSFRILMVGFAKYNMFNWAITLIAHLIVASVLGGLVYLLIQFKR